MLFENSDSSEKCVCFWDCNVLDFLLIIQVKLSKDPWYQR